MTKKELNKKIEELSDVIESIVKNRETVSNNIDLISKKINAIYNYLGVKEEIKKEIITIPERYTWLCGYSPETDEIEKTLVLVKKNGKTENNKTK